jgi:hypothetical protein
MTSHSEPSGAIEDLYPGSSLCRGFLYYPKELRLEAYILTFQEEALENICGVVGPSGVSRLSAAVRSRFLKPSSFGHLGAETNGLTLYFPLSSLVVGILAYRLQIFETTQKFF